MGISLMTRVQVCLSLTLSIAVWQPHPSYAIASQGPDSSGKTASNPSSVNKSGQEPETKQLTRKISGNTRASREGIYNAADLAASPDSKQVSLFFGKNKNGDPSTKDPSAALSLHPAITESCSEADRKTKRCPSSSKLVAMDSNIASNAANLSVSDGATRSGGLERAGGQNLKAELAPDQVLAEAGDNVTATTPIPPVVSGTVDLEEFKPSNTIELKVSQSRTFKLRNKVIRTSISDPAIAEPVVVAENQLVLLGKTPGGSTLVIWDDAGNSVAIDIRVMRDYSQLQAMLREIDPRIIVKAFSVNGADRVVMMGDVDHSESIIRAFAVANAFMDDRNMNITVANSRILDRRPGELGGATSGGGQTGALSAISQVDRYTFFGNNTNNIARAQTITSDGNRVTSLIQVRKTPLIVLHTTFMEMNSAAVRELGLQLGIGFTSQSFAFAVGGNSSSGSGSSFLTSSPGVNGTYGTAQNPSYGSTNTNLTGIAGLSGGGSPGINYLQNSSGTSFGNPLFITPGKNPTFGASTAPVNFFGGGVSSNYTNLGQGVINGLPALLSGQSLFGSPGGATFQQSDLANMFQAVSNFASNHASRWSVNPTVQGTIGYSRSRVLAEPTLVTISGERASFLAGGEIPILQSIATAGTAAQSIVFEPYGLRINMIPVLLENGTINLQISPEERLLDKNNTFVLPNSTTGNPSTVPAFTTRKTQTTVELKPGQELFISGLVSQNSGRSLQKTPLMGEIPVLGALYRSKAFSKNESELIVSVRPEIILPGTPGQLKIPSELNKMEAASDTNILQVEPSSIDEGQYRSGQVEKSLQIPSSLPAGAPIPDSGK
jgi:Flp pilus assembly secretin CpaC